MAYLRQCATRGVMATVARKGDPDAGSIAVKVYMGAQQGRLFVPSRDLDGEEVWRNPISKDGAPTSEATIDAWLQKEIAIDPDIWIVEVEDRDGEAGLDL